ncbi:MAG: hypothetical protein ABSE41_11695 [Bacteroidota bacterium]
MRWFLFCAALLLSLAGSAFSQITADKAIGIIDDLPASRLDPTLPRTPFLLWLKELLGGTPNVQWELNDCGTVTGVPVIDDERDLPCCMEASVVLTGQRVLGIAIFVGTERKGLTDAPRVANIYIETDGTVVYFKRLSELEQALNVNRKKPGG